MERALKWAHPAAASQRLRLLDSEMGGDLAVTVDIDADIDAAEVDGIEADVEAALAGPARPPRSRPARAADRHGVPMAAVAVGRRGGAVAARRRVGQRRLDCGVRPARLAVVSVRPRPHDACVAASPASPSGGRRAPALRRPGSPRPAWLAGLAVHERRSSPPVLRRRSPPARRPGRCRGRRLGVARSRPALKARLCVPWSTAAARPPTGLGIGRGAVVGAGGAAPLVCRRRRLATRGLGAACGSASAA